MMNDAAIEVTVDAELDVAYIRLSRNAVARTVELEEDVMVDLDDMDVAVGVEVLTLDARIPFSKLEAECHVHSEVIELLRLLQPSVAASLRLTQGTDGTSRAVDRAKNLATV